MSAPDQLLVVIDPVARRCDGESVRIARDVLCGGAAAKVCLPDTPQEFARALARRGARRPVVVGDDRALVRAVALLHRGGELGGQALALVPVGPRETVCIGVSLGAPPGAVTAARAVLDGVARRLDLLVDDGGEVVVGGVRVPEGPPSPEPPAAPGARLRPPAGGTPVPSAWGTYRSLVRTLVRPGAGRAPRTWRRLRVEADGRLLADVDDPVEGVTVLARGGVAEVVVRPRADAPRWSAARAVTVSGPGGTGFRYRADAEPAGPVRSRTWTVRPAAWSLLVPAPALSPSGA
ncbi:diacylglycerol kinase [Streptomyces sudanensis]|uniref:diacylglycerol kinase n=1 Tax=Streptomyces sudanensis TaxID=436397 RepID=UPI0020CF0855|nr:diacylglycerol kinase [Streptomyces sudanensis]MCQ0001433.1 diacylglycerol kinase [Streptomyces sudanensis]